jgi:hypothetical protein
MYAISEEKAMDNSNKYFLSIIFLRTSCRAVKNPGNKKKIIKRNEPGIAKVETEVAIILVSREKRINKNERTTPKSKTK